MPQISLGDLAAASDDASFQAFVRDQWAGVHFAQFGEDLIVCEHLLPRRATGFYVDVGAHHPRRYSNTRLLNIAGWRGINIDPNRTSIDAFEIERPGDVNLRLAIASEPGEVELHQFADSAVNTIDAAQAERWSERWERVGTETVPALPLEDVLDAHVPAGVDVDFLSIDAEGADHEVLCSFDIERWRPSVIAIEIHGLDLTRAHENETVAHMTGHGYVFRSYLHVTGVFVTGAEFTAPPGTHPPERPPPRN